VPVQILVYGLIWCVLGLLSDGAWAISAGSARDWFARTPRRIEVLTAIGGAFIVGLGIFLALVPEL
jgi:threonine/homoserine/homoserine lactone efflux protein